MINYWPLLGIALVVIGFALRFNPLLVVAVAAIVTGLLGGMSFLKVLATVQNTANAAVLIASDRARMLTGTVVNATAGAALD